MSAGKPVHECTAALLHHCTLLLLHHNPARHAGALLHYGLYLIRCQSKIIKSAISESHRCLD